MTDTKKKLFFWVGIGVLSQVLTVLLVVLLVLSAGQKPEPEIAPTTQSSAPLQPEANPFSPEDFTYRNGYMTCLAAPSVLGIDVSTHQKQVDWEQVKAAGFQFVMIRLGYRGTEQGGLYEDALLWQHYEGAKAAGLRIGAYFFSQAVSPEEAVEEAEFAISLAKNMELTMPLVYDWELVGPESRAAGVDPQTLTDCSKAFCDRVKEAGYRPMVYFNTDQAREMLYLEALTEYPFWLAMYSNEMTYEYKVSMWQYTQEGSIPGIEGNVDINLYFPQE